MPLSTIWLLGVGLDYLAAPSQIAIFLDYILKTISIIWMAIRERIVR